MVYAFLAAALYAVLLGESARARTPETVPVVMSITFVGILLSLVVPPLLFKYTNNDVAPTVLTRLMERGALGSALMVLTIGLGWLFTQSVLDPGLFGEMYLFALLGVFLFQGFDVVVTNHTLYLQQTHQYNSNQLFALLVAVTLLIFTLVLYFLGFDLARPPEFHAYLRDIVAITLTLVGYGRAVYLMAHH